MNEQRIKELEQCLAPFAKLGGQLGFQSDRADEESVIATLAGKVTIGDFRRAAAALRQVVGAQGITPRTTNSGARNG